jgi:hypothetical protein
MCFTSALCPKKTLSENCSRILKRSDQRSAGFVKVYLEPSGSSKKISSSFLLLVRAFQPTMSRSRTSCTGKSSHNNCCARRKRPSKSAPKSPILAKSILYAKIKVRVQIGTSCEALCLVVPAFVVNLGGGDMVVAEQLLDRAENSGAGPRARRTQGQRQSFQFRYVERNRFPQNGQEHDRETNQSDSSVYQVSSLAPGMNSWR